MAVAAESQYHVLAVDDSITDRKLIERLLKTESFQVTTVDSGTKALEFLVYQHEIEVNLIITDYCMPGMTGYDLLKKIKELSCLKDIPVVIMSSENVPARINRCLEEGAEEFFLKPVQLSDMNRLRPHLMKTKSKEEKELLLLVQEDDATTRSGCGCGGGRSSSDDGDNSNNNNNNSNNNRGIKRGAMEEEDILPEKTRPRLCSTASLTVE